MTENLLKPDAQEEDQLHETNPALRPKSFSDFVGQKKVVQNLSTFIQAARKLETHLDHVLLSGPPGLGKTTLAQIIANELGVGFKLTSGPIISKAGDLAALLTSLQPNDILFIDEIHRLPITVEEILYPAMEDGKIDILIGEGPGARSIQITLPPFTLIGATTRSGLLSQPLRERFGIPLTLQFYDPAEIEVILQKNAKKLSMTLDKSGAEEISKRCRGTPRIAGRLLRRVRDIAVVLEKDHIDAQLADHALNQLEIDHCGFDETDRKYLTAIENHYQGGPVGVETLAALLSEQRDMLEDVIEPYLIQQGYIQRTPRGRMLTLQGKNYVIQQHHAKYAK